MPDISVRLKVLTFSRQILIKLPNIKFHENPSSGIRVDNCGRTDVRTDMMKLFVTSRNFSNGPKIKMNIHVRPCIFTVNRGKAGDNVHRIRPLF